MAHRAVTAMAAPQFAERLPAAKGRAAASNPATVEKALSPAPARASTAAAAKVKTAEVRVSTAGVKALAVKAALAAKAGPDSALRA